MPCRLDSKGASIQGALFSLCLLLGLSSSASQAAACPAQEISERVRVVYVYDGDTVKLADGRRLRLIGINAPELHPEHASAEPFATTARMALEDLIDRHNRTLLLQYDQQYRDHYGRLLAHAYLDSGTNVAAHLLAAGLAITLAVPPNTWSLACYQRQEDQARIARRGIWDHPRYQVRDSQNLLPSANGFTIIHGRVQDVSRAGGTLWLDLAGPLTARIAKQDQANFPAGFLEHLPGQTVELRGWIRSRTSDLILTIRHPAAITVISPDNP